MQRDKLKRNVIFVKSMSCDNGAANDTYLPMASTHFVSNFVRFVTLNREYIPSYSLPPQSEE